MKKDEELSAELYHVAREKGTERPFTGKYHDSHEKGMYRCAICGTELFSSETKFDSGTGWPSFTSPSQSAAADWEGKPANPTNIELRDDMSFGPPSSAAADFGRASMKRTEVVCKTCGAHLGHVFDDGPSEKGGKRYCINSVCLDLEKKE